MFLRREILYLRNRVKLAVVIIIAIIVIFASLSILVDRSFEYYAISDEFRKHGTTTSNTVVRVGIIGDSWVSDNKLKQSLDNIFKKQGLQVTVLSFGMSGANSRDIYRQLVLYDREDMLTISRLKNSSVKYCVVIAGVNDTAGHEGEDFYAYYMQTIIVALLSNDIVPIVLNIPYYGIEYVKGEKLMTKVKRVVYRYLFDGGKKNVIGEYRNALSKQLSSSNVTGYIMVDIDAQAPNYILSRHLYRDEAHLNDSGYAILGEEISNVILQDLKNIH